MEIHYSKQAIKFLKKLDKTTRQRIVTAIRKIPYGDIKKMQGNNEFLYRLHVGNYRIIFNKQGQVCYIEKIDNRGQVYKK